MYTSSKIPSPCPLQANTQVVFTHLHLQTLVHFRPICKVCVTHLHFLKNSPPLAHCWPVPKWHVTHLHFENTPPVTHFYIVCAPWWWKLPRVTFSHVVGNSTEPRSSKVPTSVQFCPQRGCVDIRPRTALQQWPKSQYIITHHFPL